MKLYKLFPIRESDKNAIDENLLKQIIFVMETILKEPGACRIITNGIEVTTSKEKMRKIIKSAGLEHSCVIEEHDIVTH